MKDKILDFCKENGIEPYELISKIDEQETWISDLKIFCDRYDFNPRFLAESINDPKVIPMIRGKAFEFSAKDALKNILPETKYETTTPKMNAQTGSHDIDVLIHDKENNVDYSIECKLAKKGSFKVTSTSSAEAAVKCMRSRTLGIDEIKRRTKGELELSEMLAIHSDQYQKNDFDIVMTSLSNSFFETDKNDSTFLYQPSKKNEAYLKQSGVMTQSDCFKKMYVALSRDLIVDKNNPLKNQCTRKKCKIKGTHTDCGFIPNNPKIKFGKTLDDVKAPWVKFSDIESLLNKLK